MLIQSRSDATLLLLPRPADLYWDICFDFQTLWTRLSFISQSTVPYFTFYMEPLRAQKCFDNMTPASIYYSFNPANFQWLFFRISKSYFSSELPFEIGSCLCEKRGGVGVGIFSSVILWPRGAFATICCSFRDPWKIMHWNSSSLVKLLLPIRVQVLLMEWNHFIERNGK